MTEAVMATNPDPDPDPDPDPKTAVLIDTEEKLIAHVNSLPPPPKYDMALAMHQMMQHLNPPLWVRRVPSAETTNRHYAHSTTETKDYFNEPVDGRNRKERRRDRALGIQSVRKQRPTL